MDVVFESENILYVRPSFDLIPDYLEMVNDIDHVARFIGERREPYTEEEERSYMQGKMDQHAAMFSMLERDTYQFIGNLEFMNFKDDEAEWGIVMTHKMQDKGYGTEAIHLILDMAFRELDMNRVSIGVVGLNIRALEFYRKIGFKQEGILEQGYYYKGEYSDFIMMRILRGEWL